MPVHAFRLRPGQDLRVELRAYVAAHAIEAAYVITCVGSLTHTHLRYANAEAGTHAEGHFEILSLSGTLGLAGLHLHLGVADERGRARGGHLLDGNLVYTTAEIVLGALDNRVFAREVDPTYGYRELVVRPRG